MKNIFLVMGVICIIFLSTCATSDIRFGPEVAYRTNHFNYYVVGRSKGFQTVTITGIKKDGFTTIHIPAEIKGIPVTRIGDYAFSNRKNLVEVILPDSIRNINGYAFANCGIRGELIIHGNNFDIGSGAFENNEITKVTFTGSTFDWIRSRAFAGNKLTSIELPERGGRVLAIDAFADNNFSAPIAIPDTVNRFLIPDSIRDFYIGFKELVQLPNEINYGIKMAGNWMRDLNRGSRFQPVSIVTIPNYVYGIPVTHILAGFHNGYIRNYGTATPEIRRLEIGTLVLPEHLQEIETDAFAFCTINRVVFPNARVQNIWDEYIIRQVEADILIVQLALNISVEGIRELSEEFKRRTEERNVR
jgi:hypothetical protein